MELLLTAPMQLPSFETVTSFNARSCIGRMTAGPNPALPDANAAVKIGMRKTAREGAELNEFAANVACSVIGEMAVPSTVPLRKQYPIANGSVLGGAAPVFTVPPFSSTLRIQLNNPVPFSPQDPASAGRSTAAVMREDWITVLVREGGAVMLMRRMRKFSTPAPGAGFVTKGSHVFGSPHCGAMVQEVPTAP
jgi:hypothetical protein